MTTPPISKKTAKISASLIRTMGDQGVLPKTEAQAAAAVLLSAATAPKADARQTRDKPRLVTTGQAAERLSCSRKTILRMADDGVLTRRYLRAGNAKSLRFCEAELSALCGLPQEAKP